ncbi:MAG TPA: DUF2064 domain-containing protein [Candidatus Dormibacteraeota bacterium]|nr:DUF2064 domain-containing protein [Candidatus Dormibacteraeota bacterium]
MVEHRLAAVVPAWNEVAAIGGVVSGLLAAGACCVYVVDPGSTDGTQDASREAGASVIEEPRRGYGQASLTGALAARGHDLIAFLDGDGSCDPADLPRVAAAAGAADLVLGRRQRIGPGALPWHARFGNCLICALLRARTCQKVRDVPPFKVVRADALAAIGPGETGYGWTVELVGRALAHPAMRVAEVPVGFHPRVGGESKVSGRLVPSMLAGLAMLGQARSATRGRGLLVMMAKAPRRGHYKTRLAEDIGVAAAHGFWTASLQDSARTLLAAGREAGLDVLAMVPSPADAVAVRELTGLPCLAQSRPGLGQALFEVSELPAPYTVAVSADTPTLPVERLLLAVEALRSAPAVLGPCEDGGYYLVGLRRAFPVDSRRRAFLQVPMGGPGVLEHTRSALGAPVELEPWLDVDTLADLECLARRLQEDPWAAPAVVNWLAERRHSERVPPSKQEAG